MNQPTKEAHTFYAMLALLKTGKYYGEYLIGHEAVAMSLKQAIRTICNRITDLEKGCSRSVDTKDAEVWRKEWTEKDSEVYSSVLFSMNDMSEEKRAILEQFAGELLKGTVKMEAA